MSSNTIPHTQPLTLNDRVKRRGHGREDLVAVLEAGCPAEHVKWIALYKFPDRDEDGHPLPQGDGPFAWVGILRKHGWTDEAVRALLLEVLAYPDPNTDFPMALYNFVGPQGEKAWEVLRPDDVLNALNPWHERMAYDILRNLRWIARAIGTAKGAPHEERERTGWNNACLLAKKAVHHLGRIADEATLENLLALPDSALVRLTESVVRAAYTSTLTTHEVRFLFTLILQYRTRGREEESIEFALRHALTQKRESGRREGRATDGERPVWIFRNFIGIMATVPILEKTREEYQRDRGEHFTAEDARALHVRRLTREFREVLEGEGWRFARVIVETHAGERQFVAKITTARGNTSIFVHPSRGQRDEVIEDGMEVVVPQSLSDKPLFSGTQVRGWALELHPVAPPTSAMRKVRGGMGQ